MVVVLTPFFLPVVVDSPVVVSSVILQLSQVVWVVLLEELHSLIVVAVVHVADGLLVVVVRA